MYVFYLEAAVLQLRGVLLLMLQDLGFAGRTLKERPDNGSHGVQLLGFGGSRRH